MKKTGHVVILLGALLIFSVCSSMFVIPGQNSRVWALTAVTQGKGTAEAKARAGGSERKDLSVKPMPGSKMEMPRQGSTKKTHYYPGKRRDPFYSIVDGEFESEFPSKLPNISECDLVGIVWGNGEWLAILEDGEEWSYVVREGDPVVHGYVIQVKRTEVIFSQRGYADTRTVSLKLRDKEKGRGTKSSSS